MILLDHNIPEHQVELLRQARLQPQQIGRDVGRPEWQDFDAMRIFFVVDSAISITVLS